MKKVIRLTESDLERIIKKVINEQSKDEITYSVQKGQNGKFRIFVTTPKYKSPVDASNAFGQGDMWKDYNTQDDAQKVINSITGNNTMKLGGPKHKMSPKHLTMESELERIIGNIIKK